MKKIYLLLMAAYLFSCGSGFIKFAANSQSGDTKLDSGSTEQSSDATSSSHQTNSQAVSQNTDENDFSFPEDTTGAYLTCVESQTGGTSCGYPTDKDYTTDGQAGSNYASPDTALSSVKVKLVSLSVAGDNPIAISLDVPFAADINGFHIDDFRRTVMQNYKWAEFHVTFKDDQNVTKDYRYRTVFISDLIDSSSSSSRSFPDPTVQKCYVYLFSYLKCPYPDASIVTVDGKPGTNYRDAESALQENSHSKIVSHSFLSDGSDAVDADVILDFLSMNSYFKIKDFSSLVPKGSKWAKFHISFEDPSSREIKTYVYETTFQRAP